MGKKDALSIHLSTNRFAPKLTNNSYSINNLIPRRNSSSLIVDGTDCRLYNEEGFLTHEESQHYRWQKRLALWSKNVLCLSPARSYRI